MIQVIKFTILESLETVESKINSFMQTQSKDLEDVSSTPSILDNTLGNVYDLGLDDNTSLIVLNKGQDFYFLEILKKSDVKVQLEDMTSLYYTNKLQKLIPNEDLSKFNEILSETLSVDDVLDKINESGINSLNEVDRLVLSNN